MKQSVFWFGISAICFVFAYDVNLLAFIGGILLVTSFTMKKEK